ncbi:hypothetical protein [Kitasatospora sp. NPDC059673]|uniref:hypothetical protein n=1 Tax=Kitasatospora sp. NPDC059673 TaxID=3346901 RepID=UPI00367B2E3E
MTAARRRQIAWGLRGLALVSAVAYLPGLQASSSGGLVEVAHWLNHPVPLIGVAVVLVVISLVVELEFRTWVSQVGCAIGLVALIFVGVPLALVSFVFSGEGRNVVREPDPEHSGRVLAVTDITASIDPVYEVQVLTGSGWSARHWDLGVWSERDKRGWFKGAEWSGPNQITVTSEREIAVFTLDPASGRPSEPRTTPR